MGIVSKIKKRFGLYNLRKEGVKWVRKNIGDKYVNEFCEKYDRLNAGMPIGGLYETVLFLDMIQRIKKET